MWAITSSLMLILLRLLTGFGIILIIAALICLFFVGRKTKRLTGKKLKRHYIPFIVLICPGLICVFPMTYFQISNAISQAAHETEWKEEDPFNYAIKKGDVDTVSELLEQGADPYGSQALENIQASYFTLACSEVTDNSCEIIKLMLDYGAQISPEDETPALIYTVQAACKKGNYPANEKEAEEQKQRYLAVVKLLLENGANPDCRERKNGYTPVMYLALGYGSADLADARYDVVSLLLEYGADINAATEVGYTALMYACGKSPTYPYVSADCVEFLLANGSDPTMTDYQGQTALLTAKAAYQKELQKGEMKPERMEEYEQIIAMLE